MKILLDTNIVLDWVLEREPFVTDAEALIQAVKTKQVKGYLTAKTVTDVFNIARKPKGAVSAKAYIAEVLTFMQSRCNCDAQFCGFCGFAGADKVCWGSIGAAFLIKIALTETASFSVSAMFVGKWMFI
ncbi:MAG: PIN domain-containing protein [Cyanobacteriota bacterium]|nr:PIN domain-containing protein [Cyanobacteriota bacterium]